MGALAGSPLLLSAIKIVVTHGHMFHLLINACYLHAPSYFLPYYFSRISSVICRKADLVKLALKKRGKKGKTSVDLCTISATYTILISPGRF